METITTQAVLSAIITPAVLIAACGSLTISTSSRLGRMIDRSRKLSLQIQDIISGRHRPFEGERDFLYDQLLAASRRARLLQRSLQGIYMALSSFMITSISVGVVVLTERGYSFIPVLFGLLGALLLLYATILMILETRLAIRAVEREMAVHLRHHAPDTIP